MQLATANTGRRDAAGRPRRAAIRKDGGPRIAYAPARTAWDNYHRELVELIERHDVRSVCEVGGGANPALAPDEVARRQLDYTLLDVDERELAKAPEGYQKLRADVCMLPRELAGRFDLVVSRMVLEHLDDAERVHRSVLGVLRPGGLAFHFFPTLYALPFVANRLMSEHWSARLLTALAPRDPQRAGKFPAHYRWCRGPSRPQIERFERVGFEVVAYRGFFGHDYYARIPLVRHVERLANRLLVRHPLPCLTSYAQVLLRKPLPG